MVEMCLVISVETVLTIGAIDLPGKYYIIIFTTAGARVCPKVNL
jgi:hypothetical protein